jgi:peptidoglycan/xylan/chitin deacetylase (PgdA/CDA1 family)
MNTNFGQFITLIRRTLYTSFGWLFLPAQVSIYCYHSIDSDKWRFTVSEQSLKKQVGYLLHYSSPITTETLMNYLDGNQHNLRSGFILTFDDGYKDLLKIKDYLPSLGIRPIVFVLSEPLRANRAELETDKELLSIQDIKQLHQSGWEIGCHSATHADFKSLSTEQLNFEIKQAKQTLEDSLGIPVNFFAYPKGKYNSAIVNAVKEAGFKIAFSMDHRLVSPGIDKLSVPRVGVDNTHKFAEFRGMSTKPIIWMKNFGTKVLKEGIYD